MQGMDLDILNLLETMGSTITLISRSQTGSYDPVTGTVPDTTVNNSVTACIVNYTDEERLNTSIQESDRKVIIAGLNIPAEPDIDDQILAFGKTYEITRVQEIKCGATIIAYICQVQS